MKKSTLFIIPWATVHVGLVILVLSFVPLLFGKVNNSKLAQMYLSWALFWVGWASCRFRDWIIKKSKEMGED